MRKPESIASINAENITIGMVIANTMHTQWIRIDNIMKNNGDNEIVFYGVDIDTGVPGQFTANWGTPRNRGFF